MSNSVMEVMEGYQVSPQQQRLWRLQQHSAAYGLQVSVRLEGTVERWRLRQALAQVVARHEALRTSFQQRAGMKYPLQVIAEQGEYEWRESDLRGLSEAEQETRLAELRTEQRQAGRGSEPVLRAHLVALGAQRAELSLSLPAMCGDSETL